MDFFEMVGNNILIELENRNWTQSMLADKIGISRQVFQKIIKGKKAINAYEIAKIAKILGVTTDKLLNTNEEVYWQEDSQIQFLGAFNNEDNFKLLKSIIEEYVTMEENLHELLLSKKYFTAKRDKNY
ncbi:helix-turn-helix domain-containing protein [Clostridium sp. DJ247]|uniref:helix-turn-helix domain-containing protein n=1 Tax=Clostridium sp. DJ247 TaxID=2726188 RepID=UPI0016287953|nr:helix-turn-helix domain-containing protein [Clostridium sp. DJ247]MBC2582690.1 helix-turn-helix transcriptional regulator [Clostridium sp. DJ247]